MTWVLLQTWQAYALDKWKGHLSSVLFVGVPAGALFQKRFNEVWQESAARDHSEQFEDML